MTDKILSLRPNRPSLNRYLASYIRRTQDSDRLLALLAIQIKRGQEFSALFGHNRSEALLEYMAERLDNVCRRDDRIIRTGDYEFTMILPDVFNEGHAILAANKILRSLETPFEIDGTAITTGIHIGIALYPEHAATPENLVQHAALALTSAESNNQPYAVYSAAAPDEISDAWDIEGEMDVAMQNGEMQIYYQPKINLRGGLPCGAEALLRWQSPRRGLVPPSMFIPIALRTGQLKALTWSALNMSLEHAANWPMRFGPLSVAVNISPSLLDDDSLINRVVDAMAIWGTKPNRLILEITESAVMRHPELSFDTIRGLKDKGVGVSIDDFGTGYSSLANFKSIPATELKIDKSFVMNLLTDKADAGIVRTIIGLGQAFDLQVAAEGAEDLETLKMLKNMGCHSAQGYYISQPLPPDAFVKFINEYTPASF
ncbi:MAG TPA: bifunctional diguanylate cyclase/phosphodiesterase [Gammaproteobacteria bacterium]|nr:bifunctional diguanylate cyclase/phosphodiesterase [Gammaproteobacteria bacterium]